MATDWTKHFADPTFGADPSVFGVDVGTHTLSSNGKKFLQLSEGLSLKAYPDANGYSIGYGHFGAKPGDVITQEQADALFDQDVKKFEDSVNRTTPKATQQQFDALVHFAYNVGVAGFETSTVARLLNQGDIQGAADAFRMWTKSNGAVNQELVKRRERERAYFLTGDSNVTTASDGTPNASTTGKKSVIGEVLAGVALAAGVTYGWLKWQTVKTGVNPLKGILPKPILKLF